MGILHITVFLVLLSNALLVNERHYLIGLNNLHAAFVTNWPVFSWRSRPRGTAKGQRLEVQVVGTGRHLSASVRLQASAVKMFDI